MKVTPFGRYLRKLRIDNGVILKDVADELEVSPAYLSSIELGKKNISNEFISRISTHFKLSGQQSKELRSLASLSQPQVKIDLKDNSDQERELVMAFARGYKNKTEEERKKLLDLLGG